MSEKQRFQEILSGIRTDLRFFKEILFPALVEKIKKNEYEIDAELKDWIYDTFLDKLYEFDAKINRILKDFKINLSTPKLTGIVFYAQEIAYPSGTIVIPASFSNMLRKLYEEIEKYESEVEMIMSLLRSALYKANWELMKTIKTEDYILPIRRARYVKARDELKKAKQAVKNKEWDEVLNHLRPAIDLATNERFGFDKISPMKQFIMDAEKYNLPLPSYAMLYDYFDEGSRRIHGGKLHTPWECEKALNFVTEFIERLELISISEKDIEQFKKKCNAVS